MPEPLTIIVNPVAGRGRSRKLFERLPSEVAAWGLDAEIVISPDPTAPPQLARSAFARGRRVVACGGDGLVGCLAEVAVEADGVFGLLPFGSGNDFARHLGFDLANPMAALSVLAGSRPATVDVGSITGSNGGKRIYCSIAGSGFDADATSWANGIRLLTGTPLYIAAVLRTLITYRPRRFRFSVDGAVYEESAWLVAVANGGFYGGGMMIAPNARINDGLLDVVVVGPVSRSGFLRTFPKVYAGRHLADPAVRVYSGQMIDLEQLDNGEPLPLIADGESVGLLGARLEILPEALKIVVPDGFRDSQGGVSKCAPKTVKK